MEILDRPQDYKKLDPTQIIQNILELPDQMGIVWQEMKKFVLPSHYIQCKKIVMTGMGGSSMGAALVKTLTDPTTKMPIEVVREYNLPNYVDEKTLVIGISYSGNTEETVSAVSDALKRGGKIIGISSGGKMETLSRKHHFPFYKINYGSQPRAALGYSYTALLAIMSKLGNIEITDEMIKKTVSQMKLAMKKISPENETAQNPAKQMARQILGKIPVIIGAQTMSEVARRYKGQFNENSKSTAYFEALPEMNHGALAGTVFPEKVSEKIFVIFLSSKFNHPQNKKRIDITGQIFEKRRIPYEIIEPSPAANPMAEQMLSIHFGDFVSYYLALLHNTDPEEIEIVDFLKESLKR
ncbi:MAG: glucose/mannose-6-phosphate isomerase [Candidatus Berkelbacteria bacterium Licking1014_7]|uniref:Glutamine--fructose-6-phosphate aminotransferase [isomerizing] n=1 Tax=Candidatus Berkelbacteria bacterium Licking1014_7 TaxID=2017147 RepID=A0A554LHW2_9BACT|nr:MAG: glucose/mannose-6-phosphate isomerase [Candidatus Berkelbacteria bacterium Licking1014_7]